MKTPRERIPRYLFVCAGGIDRSPIAAGAARAMAAERGRTIEADYLGIWDPMTTNFLKPGHFDQYDLVFVMEEYMGRELREKWGCKGEIVCLDVQDNIRCLTSEDAQMLDRIMRMKLDRWI